MELFATWHVNCCSKMFQAFSVLGASLCKVVGNFDWEECALIMSEFHRTATCLSIVHLHRCVWKTSKAGTRTHLRERTRDGVTVTSFGGVMKPQELPAATPVPGGKIIFVKSLNRYEKSVFATKKSQRGHKRDVTQSLLTFRQIFTSGVVRRALRSDRGSQWCSPSGEARPHHGRADPTGRLRQVLGRCG